MEGRINVLLINENPKNRKLNDFFQAKEKFGGKPDLKLNFCCVPQYIYKELSLYLYKNGIIFIPNVINQISFTISSLVHSYKMYSQSTCTYKGSTGCKT